MEHARPRPRRTAAVSLAAVAALALAAPMLAGCSDDPAPVPGARADGGSTAPSDAGTSSGAATTSPAPSGSASAAPAAAPEVDLLDAGSGPRRRLTLDLEQGHRETSTLRMTMRMDLGPAGPVDLPFTVSLATAVTEAGDAGYTTQTVLGKPDADVAGLPAGVGPVLERSLGLLEGATVSLGFSRAGALTSSDVEAADGAPADLVARMMDAFVDQAVGLAVPLPDRAVGVGARWRAVSTVRLSGTTATVTASYELTSLGEDDYTLALTLQERTRPGTVAGGGSIVQGSSSGSGTLTGRTGLVLPATARSSLAGSTVVEIGGQQVRTTFGTTVRLTTR